MKQTERIGWKSEPKKKCAIKLENVYSKPYGYFVACTYLDHDNENESKQIKRKTK